MQWFSRIFGPFLDWIQVEVTSQCNANCLYCPHTVFKESWQSVHMPVDLYRRLTSAFPRTNLVYLQGWGEPLLHPQFFEMVQIARQLGCQVGTTTNGVLLERQHAERMVQERLAVVGLSLAGTDASQDTIRQGAPLASVLRAMQRLFEAKKRASSPFPEIHVAYLWLRSRRDAIKRLPALLEGRGVSQSVVSTLDFVPHPELEDEVIEASNAEEEAELINIMSEVTTDGKKRGIEIVFRVPAPYAEPGMCTENVTKALVVSCRGLVSPCVLRNLPLTERAAQARAASDSGQCLIFGDIHERTLAEIWRSRPYKTFRADHAKSKPPHECGSCAKRFCRTFS
jgi:MoaA/NifB/PqqE/SkfB family radical SAM enzyme